MPHTKIKKLPFACSQIQTEKQEKEIKKNEKHILVGILTRVTISLGQKRTREIIINEKWV